MQRILELTVRVNEDDFEIDFYEPESGECTQMHFPFSPDEHPEFDKKLGNEIYSWLSIWFDQKNTEKAETIATKKQEGKCMTDQELIKALRCDNVNCWECNLHNDCCALNVDNLAADRLEILLSENSQMNKNLDDYIAKYKALEQQKNELRNENVEQILNPLWRDGYHAAAQLIENLLADNKKLMDQLSLYASQKQNRSGQIYQFEEHNFTVSGEEDDLIRLAEVLRYEEGTLGDLRFQIEVAFNIDGIGTSSEE